MVKLPCIAKKNLNLHEPFEKGIFHKTAVSAFTGHMTHTESHDMTRYVWMVEETEILLSNIGDF